LTGVVAATDRVIGLPHPTAGSLHRLHRELRRLRSGLAIWEQLLDPRERERLKPLDRRLKRLARLVGRIRDRDIAIQLLAHIDQPEWPPEEIARLAEFRTQQRDDARTGRELLRAFLRAERASQLFEAVAGRWRAPRVRYRVRDVRDVLRRACERGEERVRSAHRTARKKPTVARMHRLRLRVRSLRHVTDLARTLDPTHTPPTPALRRRLQAELGRLHDLDVVLGSIAPGVGETAWADLLRDQRKELRHALRASLRSRPRPTPGASRAPLRAERS
jgi:CHAD domain-containing protein